MFISEYDINCTDNVERDKCYRMKRHVIEELINVEQSRSGLFYRTKFMEILIKTNEFNRLYKNKCLTLRHPMNGKTQVVTCMESDR